MRKILLSALGLLLGASVSVAAAPAMQYKSTRTSLINAKNLNKNSRRHGPRVNAPEGDVKPYSLACNGFFMYDGYFVSEYTDQGFATQVVFTDDNRVCLYDLITCLPSISCLEAELPAEASDEIVKLSVSLPQQYIVDEEVAEQFGIENPLYIRMLDVIEGFDYDYEVSENQELLLDYDPATGEISLELDESRIIGLCDADDNWLGYGMYELFYTPFTDKALELPEGLEIEPWACISDGQGRMVKVAFDGSDVYIGGFCPSLPDSWMKGTIDGDEVKFASEQYLGYDAERNHYAYVLAGVAEEYYDEEWEDWVVVVLVNEYLTMSYDAENRVMDAGDEFIIINGGIGNFYFLDYLMRPKFRYQDGYSQSAPANPEIMQFDAPSGGYPGGVVFDAPQVDNEGKLLDADRIYYRLFNPDMEVITFTPDEYYLLDEPISVFPLNFMDNADGYGDFSMYEGMHTITLYDDALTMIGVQTMLLDDSGEWQYSDIVFSDGNLVPSAVKSIVGSREIETTTWFSVNGTELNRPTASGLYIRVERFKDGTTRSAKILVK